MPNKVLIIIPTYNESENIVPLIEGIFTVLPAVDILFIDDSSPDGTGEIIDSVSKRDSRVILIRRASKLGLGSAYVTGFKYALSNDYKFIFQMDADFSHHPRYLTQLLREAENYPIVLGSRYVKGGSILGWSMHRIALSRFGSFYARLLLGLKIRDLTSGYKCFQRRVIGEIMMTPLNSEGYVFQIETIFKAHKKGFSIKEIPIIFENRRKGASKISKKIILEAVFKVCAMAVKRR